MAKKKVTRKQRSKKDPSPYPKGWNRKRVQAIADYYDNQTDEEAIAEAEAAYKNRKFTMMAVPVELVEAVEKLIARKRAG
jgi:hypothetical protein